LIKKRAGDAASDQEHSDISILEMNITNQMKDDIYISILDSSLHKEIAG
jgi:hypothetical protein